jgi:hypothetical protein
MLIFSKVPEHINRKVEGPLEKETEMVQTGAITKNNLANHSSCASLTSFHSLTGY